MDTKDILTTAYQSYEAAKKSGDELEAVRLWVIFLDLLKAQKPKATSQTIA